MGQLSHILLTLVLSLYWARKLYYFSYEGDCIKSVPVKKVYDELMSKAQNLPFASGRDLLPVLFLKTQPKSLPGDIIIFTPQDIIDKY